MADSVGYRPHNIMHSVGTDSATGRITVCYTRPQYVIAPTLCQHMRRDNLYVIQIYFVYYVIVNFSQRELHAHT